LPETGREVGDAHGIAVRVGQDGGDNRGVTNIVRLKVGHAIQHDIAEALFFVAREQAREYRVRVEAREAPPYESRGRIDKSRRAAVADDGKIEPMIDHSAIARSLSRRRASQALTLQGA